MALTSITKDFVIKAGALTEGTSFVTSSTGQTGTLQVNGGAAIAKNLIVGTTATIWGAQTNNGSLTVNGLTTLQGLTATTSTLTSLQVTGPSLFQGQTLFTGAVNTFSGALFVTGTNILTVGTGATNLGGSLTVAGVTSVTNNTTANYAGNTAAFLTTGGAQIGDNLVVRSTAYNTATNTANAIYTPGGIYADGGLTVGSNGPVLFKGPVTFSGTATYILSTNTFWTDNILELHVPPSGVYGSWTQDDGKDVGLRFHYYTAGADTNAALVLANDTKWLEWYGTGAEGTSTFSGSSYGNFKTGGIWATQNIGVGYTSAQVGEKLGVNGGVYVNGSVTATTFIGNLTGTSTNATNINGGAAGSLVYQSAPSTTALLPIGTNGQLLYVAGGNPTWTNPSGLTAGNATTSSNIAGGLKDQIPYQSGPGQTVFSSALTFNGTTFTTTNVVVSGTSNSTGYNNGTGALQVKGGAAINNDLWVGGDINLQGSLYLKGVGLDQITGSTGTFDYVIIEGTGTVLTVSDTVDINGTTGVYSTNSGALQVTGGVGIGGSIFVGGTVTATTSNITGNETVGGSLTVTGFSLLNGGATISAATVTNNLTVGGHTIHTGYTSMNGGATASALTVTNAATVGTTLTVTGYSTLGLLRATDTTVTNLTVTGNETVSGNLTVTGYGTISGGSTISALTVTNAATVGTSLAVTGFSSLNGGATASALTVTNTLLVNGTTPSLGASNAGAIQTTGGVGIAKDIYVASTATIAGITYHNNTTPTLASATQGAIQTTGGVGIAKDLYVGTTATIAGNASVTGTLNVTGRTTLNDTVVNTTLTATNLVITGSATLPSGVNLTNLTVTNLTVTNNETVGGTLTVTGLTALNGGMTTGIFTASGVTYLTNTTDSNAINNGALVVSGGVGIAKSLVVGEDITIGNATTQTVVNSYYSNNTLLSSYTSGYIQTNSVINLDTFSSTSYRTAKYVVQVVDGTKIHVEEILVFHDGTNVYMTEYAIATSQGELGTFDAGLAAGTITLSFQANYTPTQMTIKMTRQTITL